MSVVPRSARYNVLPMGIPSQRRSVRQGVQTGNSFKPDGTKIIRINIPQQSYLDCSNTYLTFRHKIHDTDGSQTNVIAQSNLKTDDACNSEICMDNGAYSWIRNIQVQGADGTVLENIQNYNLLSRVLHRATQPNDHNESSASILQGYGDISERQSWGTNTLGRTYAIQLSASGILSNSKYIPLKYLQGGLTIQIELDDFNRCHQANATGYSYTIDQVYLHMDLVDFSDEFDAMFRNQLASEGVNLHFDTYSSHIDTLTGSAETHLEISERASSVKSVYTVIRDNTSTTDVLTDSLGSWTSRELKNYKYTLGTTDYPRYDVNCEGGGAVAYAEMLKGFGTLGDINGGSEIDSNGWRGVSDEGSDKYLEITFVKVLPASNPSGNDTDTGAISEKVGLCEFTVQGKHGLTGGTNNIGDTATAGGSCFRVSNCVEVSFNATGTAGTAHNAGAGCWICVASISDSTFIAVKSQGGIDADGLATYTEVGTAMATTLCAFNGRIRVASSKTDGGDVKFMLAQNFENHFENQILQTGVSASGAVPLSLKLNTDSTATNVCRVDTFVHSDKMLTIGADGLATISV